MSEKRVAYAEKGDRGGVLFMCPGCKCGHLVTTKAPNDMGAQWTWNGSLTAPTFQPSILLQGNPRCHSFVENGMIRFLSDCSHELAGKTVPLEEW